MKNKERPKLNTAQKMKFLKMVAQLASNSAFERELALTQGDIESYKKEFDIESQDDARRAYKILELALQQGLDENAMAQIKKQREAEAVANQRLKEIEHKKALEATLPKEKIDVNAIKIEDAARQKRFDFEQAELEKVILTEAETWILPLEGNEFDKKNKVERFRKDIEYCGMNFCATKYAVSTKQIKAEAIRLGLKIRWDIVKR